MEAQGIRLNKFLSEAGVCSRREADRLAEEGRITIDGREARPGDRVLPGQKIVCMGRTITAGGRGESPTGQKTDGAEKKDSTKNGESHKAEPVFLAVNKPKGIVCTTSTRDRAENIVDMVGYPVRIYPVGRLDKDSEGLIFMTNQGDLVNKIMRSGNYHEKEYLVGVNRPVTDEFIQKMRQGVYLEELDTVTRPCFAEKTGNRSFRIILTQGLNRQIRRMCMALGYRVRTLKRVRIMNVRLGDLPSGQYRNLTREEYRDLLSQLKDSSNQPAAMRDEERRGAWTKKSPK